MLQHFLEKKLTVAALKMYADNLRASEHKLSGSACILKGTAKPNQKGSGTTGNGGKKTDTRKCDKCKRSGHLADVCRIPQCRFCSKFGHDDSKCYTNPASASYKGTTGSGATQPPNRGQQGTAGQPTPTTGGAATGGSACFIDDNIPPTETDNLVEEVIRGTVFSIPNDATQVSQQSSPFVRITAAATLKNSGRQVVARGCADTGSSAKYWGNPTFIFSFHLKPLRGGCMC